MRSCGAKVKRASPHYNLPMDENLKKKLVGLWRQDVAMSPPDWLVDCVIAAGTFGFGMMQLALSANLFVPDAFTRMILGIQSVKPSMFAILGTLIMCLPLIVRRQHPWPVFMLTLALWVILDWGLRIDSLSIASSLVALFTVAYARGGIEALVAGALTLVGVSLSVIFGTSTSLAALLVFQNSSFAVAVALAGYAMHAHKEYVASAEARAREAERLRDSESKRALEAERTRESEASRRVEAERVRIAREVHDITAHSLSAVSIQAAAAERLIDTDPLAAKNAIEQVRLTSKAALGEMRAMIGVLRGDESAQVAPTEGTERMGDLVDYLKDAKVRCELDMSRYDRAHVPAYIDVALFGIAREACTNIVRHAHAKHAGIVLESDLQGGGGVALRVSDDGEGFDAFAHGSGHGIEGMRERAKLLNGRLAIEVKAEGGTLVEAHIPVKSPIEARLSDE